MPSNCMINGCQLATHADVLQTSAGLIFRSYRMASSRTHTPCFALKFWDKLLPFFELKRRNKCFTWLLTLGATPMFLTFCDKLLLRFSSWFIKSITFIPKGTQVSRQLKKIPNNEHNYATTAETKKQEIRQDEASPFHVLSQLLPPLAFPEVTPLGLSHLCGTLALPIFVLLHGISMYHFLHDFFTQYNSVESIGAVVHSNNSFIFICLQYPIVEKSHYLFYHHW